MDTTPDHSGGRRALPWAFALVLPAVLWAGFSPALARDAYLTFERFSTDQGLSNAEIHQVHIDRRGILWIATAYGLNRYDGTGFTIFQHEPDDSLSLSASWVNRIYEDRSGMLWMTHFTEGLTRFDSVSGRARLFAHEPDRPGSLSAGPCLAIAEDRRGRLWVAAGTDGLCRLDPGGDAFTHYRTGLAGSPINDIVEGPDGRLWAAVPEGLKIVDPETGAVTPVPCSAGDPPGRIRILNRDRAGTMRVIAGAGNLLVAAPDGAGGFRLRPAGPPFPGDAGIRSIQESARHPGRFHLALRHGWVGFYEPAANRWERLGLEAAGSDSAPEVQILHESRDGTLWAGTSAGLFALESGSPQFERVPVHSRNSSAADLAPDITDICEDDSGLLWIGTRGMGLLKVNPRQKLFHHDFFNPRFLGAVDEISVSGIVTDLAGVLWIGTVARGLYRYNRETQSVVRYAHAAGDPASLSNDHVTVLLPAATGDRLWIGTRSGLNLFDRRTGRCRRYLSGPAEPGSSPGLSIQSLAEDPSGDVWIGFGGGGLSRLHPESGEVQHFSAIPGDTLGLADNQIPALCVDHRGDLWIGTVPAGLHRFDRATGTFERFTHDRDPRLPRSIQTIREGRDGRLYLGSYSDGLIRFDPATGNVARWSRSSGLPGNLVLSILEDASGNLWLGSDRGLTRLDPATGAARIFGTTHGVQDRQFLINSCWRAPDGELFFGGVDGINSFYPDSLSLNAHVPPIIITDVRVNGRSLAGPLDPAAGLRLGPRDNSLSVDCVALDFTEPERNRYACRLEGLDREWVDNGTRRTVTYTNLNPGSYTLRLRGSNSDGVWNEAGLSIPIRIDPPFWRTRAFLLAAAAGLLGSAWGFHRNRLGAARRKVREMEQVRQAESERVRKQAARDFHDELGHLATRIALFGEVLRRRSPGDVERQSEYLDKIVITSKRLSQGMGDFIWMLDPEQDSLQEVAVRLKDFGDHLFEGTGVEFRAAGLAESSGRRAIPPAWRRHLTLLFKEAMHNALKHSGAERVTLDISQIGEAIRLAVADDGHGFDPSRPEAGRGLHSMRARAGEIGGTIEILSSPDRGTTVVFTGLPAGPPVTNGFTGPAGGEKA